MLALVSLADLASTSAARFTRSAGAVNVAEEVPADGAVGPVGHKEAGEVLLQVVEPVAAGVRRAASRGEGVRGEGGRVGELKGGPLQHLTEAGHLRGDVVGHQRLHVNARLPVLHLQRLGEPLDEDLKIKKAVS